METALKSYHCVYYPNPERYVVHCINIEATSMVEAVKSFSAKFPDIEPLYVLKLTNHVSLDLPKKNTL